MGYLTKEVELLKTHKNQETLNQAVFDLLEHFAQVIEDVESQIKSLEHG